MDALRAALAQIPDEVLFVLGIIAMITLLVIAASSLWGFPLLVVTRSVVTSVISEQIV